MAEVKWSKNFDAEAPKIGIPSLLTGMIGKMEKRRTDVIGTDFRKG